ncbi:hypothetical protein ABIA53_003888 [Pseudomonas monsensis]
MKEGLHPLMAWLPSRIWLSLLASPAAAWALV